MTGPLAPWDDARLGAAFTARAAAASAAPADLVQATILAVEREPGPRRSVPRWLPAAAAIVVAVGLAGISILSLSPGRRPGGGIPPSSVAIALGEPIGVADALAIREATTDDRELVVHGFQTGWQAVPCPFTPGDPNPTRILCPFGRAWLVPARDATVAVGAAPTGPAFHASYDTIEPGFANDPNRAVEVVVIGHFHDRRAALCPPTEVAACGQTFVVDRVSFVNGGPRAITTLRDPGSTIATEDDIDRLVRAAAPGAEILSRQVRTTDGLFASEPALRQVARYASANRAWLETVVDVRDGVAVPRTFVVVDGTTDLVEITATGPVEVAPSAAASSDDPSLQSPGVSNLRGWITSQTIDVATAIDRRDHDLSGDEIAVAGWAHGPSGLLSCPMIRPGRPVALQCPATFTWISGARPPSEPDGRLTAPPQPAFNLLLSSETMSQVSIYGSEAVEVVALGHFDDPRAALCPADQVETCRRTFVVDAILDRTRADAQPRVETDATGGPLRPVATPDQVLSIATLGARGWAAILSVVAMPGGATSSAVLHAADAPELVSAPVVWVVRYLDGFDQQTPTLVTVLVIDGPAADLPNRVYVATPTELVRRTTIVN